MRKKPAFIAATTAATTGSASITIPESPAAPGISASITADPNDPDVLYVPNVALYKLSDGGKTLSIVRGAPGGDDYHQLWIDPANSSHMVLGSDQGTTVSLDGGANLEHLVQPANRAVLSRDHRQCLPLSRSRRAAGQRSCGYVSAAPVMARSISRDWFTVSGSESGYIAPDPKNPNIFYVSGTYGSVVRFDRRMTQSQNIAPAPITGFSTDIAERKYRDPWTPGAGLFSRSIKRAVFRHAVRHANSRWRIALADHQSRSDRRNR